MTPRIIVRQLAVAALVAAAALPSSAAAQQAPAAQQQRFRQAIGRIVQKQLDLTDEQAQRLAQVNARYEQERRQLAVQEREVRQLVREEMLNGEQADQDRVSRGIDRMLKVQRQRVDIVEREQKELATFLSPVQRARFLVLQDQLRRRLEEMRRQREAGVGQGAAEGDRPLLRRRLQQRRQLP